VPRERDPKRAEAERLWLSSAGKLDLVQIAAQLQLSASTVRAWKSKDKWDSKLNGALQSNERSAPNHKERSERGTFVKGNQAALGNKGGHGGPRGNDKAVTHGFFQKHLPPEAMEIMQEIEAKSPIDMLWDNIMIQYTAIIRAQQIMFVKDREDKTKEMKKDMDIGTEYDIQHAWDKQATFLSAQSKAMSTLQSMIRQYEELLPDSLATEEQKARIALLKSKVPNKDGIDPNKQITALADLINNPAPERVLPDD